MELNSLLKERLMNLANETGSADTQGSAVPSAYVNQPILYGDEFIDAAKKRFFFLDSVNVRNLPEGHKDYVEYKRNQYLGSDMTFDSGEAGDADISRVVVSTKDGVTITPTVKLKSAAIENYANRINKDNLIDEVRDELVYAVADIIDRKIAVDLGDATLATSTVKGATLLIGGSAATDAALAAGDTITPALITDGSRYLMESQAYYNNAGVMTRSAATKNPWMDENDFVLYIGPAQWATLAKDIQFTHADVYGGREVVLNGEIGKYHNVKIVVTTNIETAAIGGLTFDGSGTAGASTADIARCVLMKPKKAYTFVWGQAPTISVAPYYRRAQTDVVMETAYEGKVINDDAIVFIDVAILE